MLLRYSEKKSIEISKTKANDAIFWVLHDLYNKIYGGDEAAAVFNDLSKAFDYMSHETLFTNVSNYIIQVELRAWKQKQIQTWEIYNVEPRKDLF